MRSIRSDLKYLCILLLLNLQILPAQGIQLFRTPASTDPLPSEKSSSCFELEREIASLTPMTYSYKPGFYQNPYQGASILLGTTISPWFYLYPVYDYYLDYRENSRIIPAEERLARLRRLKADRHCFES